MGHIVVTIARTQLRVFFFWHIWRGVRQRLHQAHTNDIRRIPVARPDAAHITNGILNTTRDDGGGIEQGAVPIEGNQVKLARDGHVRGVQVQHGWQIIQARKVNERATPRARQWPDG